MLYKEKYGVDILYFSYGGTQVPHQDIVFLIKHLIDIAKLWFVPRNTNQLYLPSIGVTLRIDNFRLIQTYVLQQSHIIITLF